MAREAFHFGKMKHFAIQFSRVFPMFVENKQKIITVKPYDFFLAFDEDRLFCGAAVVCHRSLFVNFLGFFGCYIFL